MEKYPHPGSHFSKPERSQHEACEYLRSLVETTAISRIALALSGAELYLVGGSVRDAFYTTSTTDIDLTTNLAPQEVHSLCSKHGMKVVDTGIKHGTVLVVCDEQHVEVTTFRKPSNREEHQIADTVITDLSGRDFTINALAFSLHDFALIDPFGGVRDLRNGLLRAVGDPYARFLEDPLRILRMIRFGDGEGRTIDETTLQAACDSVSTLSSISVERIKSELQNILLTANPGDGIKRLHHIGGLPYTIPELIPAVGFEQNRYHIHDVFEHTISVLTRTPRDSILRWAAIFHDVGKPHTLSVDDKGERHFYSHEVVSHTKGVERMRALKFSSDEIKKIGSIVRHHMRPLQCGPAGVRRILRDLGSEYSLWRLFKEADASPAIPHEEFLKDANSFDALVKQELEKLKNPTYGTLAVRGEDLLMLGIPEGPILGAILKQLKEDVLDSPSNNHRDYLLIAAKNLYAAKIKGQSE